MLLLFFELHFLKQFLLHLLHFVAVLRHFWLYLLVKLLPKFLAKEKNLWVQRNNTFTFFNSRVQFIIYSVSNNYCWLFWSVNQTSMTWNSKSNVFEKLKFVGKSCSNRPIDYLKQMCLRILNFVDNQYLQCYNRLVLLL